jgi:hypothetical protein
VTSTTFQLTEEPMDQEGRTISCQFGILSSVRYANYASNADMLSAELAPKADDRSQPDVSTRIAHMISVVWMKTK